MSAVMLLVLLAASTAWEARKDSATWDEVGHLAAGINHWRSGDFAYYRVNPPLVRLIACAPLMLVDLPGRLLRSPRARRRRPDPPVNMLCKRRGYDFAHRVGGGT